MWFTFHWFLVHVFNGPVLLLLRQEGGKQGSPWVWQTVQISRVNHWSGVCRPIWCSLTISCTLPASAHLEVSSHNAAPESCVLCPRPNRIWSCHLILRDLPVWRGELAFRWHVTVSTAFRMREHLVVTSQWLLQSPGSVFPSLCPNEQTEAKVKWPAKVIGAKGGRTAPGLRVSHLHAARAAPLLSVSYVSIPHKICFDKNYHRGLKISEPVTCC